MAKKGLIVLGIAVIVVVPLLVILLGGGFAGGNDGGNSLQSKRVSCDVEIRNPAFGNERIEGADCTSETRNLCNPLSLLSSQGNLVMNIDGKTVQQSIDIPAGVEGTSTYSISSCVSPDTTTGSISLKDDSNQVLDTQEINV